MPSHTGGTPARQEAHETEDHILVRGVPGRTVLPDRRLPPKGTLGALSTSRVGATNRKVGMEVVGAVKEEGEEWGPPPMVGHTLCTHPHPRPAGSVWEEAVLTTPGLFAGVKEHAG